MFIIYGEGGGHKRSLLPYLGGGGSGRFYSGPGEEEGGKGGKRLKVDIINLRFFEILPQPHDI